MTADARRETIVDAALHCFARGGLSETTTDEIARASGVSQPYVIRLFGSKRALFAAVVERAFDEVADVLGGVPRGNSPRERIAGMQDAYRELAERREIALVLVHAMAVAVDDATVREVVHDRVQALHKSVWSAAGGDTDRVREFFGTLTLINVVAAIDTPELLGPDW